MEYDRSQTGWTLITVMLSIIFVISILYINQTGAEPLNFENYGLISLCLISILLLSYKLRVIVNAKGINIIYGIGIIRVVIDPERIIQLKKTKSSYWLGWGIRFFKGGILYNIEGRDCVEISYFKKKIKVVRIGTNDSDGLLTAIRERYKLD